LRGTFGSRQEAQGLGQALRAKADGRSARFYTVVNRGTVDPGLRGSDCQRFLAAGHTNMDADLDPSFRPSGTQGFDDLRRDATQVVVRGTPVLLASFQDIVRSKEAAGRDKDRRALPILRELVAQQLRAER